MSSGSIYQRSDGKWCASLQLDGKRKTIYGKSEWEARRKLADLQRQVATAGAVADPGRRTVNDLLDTWLAAITPTLKPRTVAEYSGVCDRYVRQTIGNLKLGRLTPDRLQRLYVALQHRDLQRAPAEVHAVLHRACRMAVLWRWLPDNPCDRIVKPRYAAPRKDVWSHEQLRSFLDGARPHRLYPLWLTAIASGCRYGELLGLRWQDVNLTEGTIAVVRNLQRVGGQWHEGTPKTASGERTIALPGEALDAFKRQKVQQAEWRLLAGSSWQDTGRVFTSMLGTPLYEPSATQRLAALCRRLNVPRATMHELRHLHASLLLTEGLPLADVSKRLGHASPNITATIYAHVVGNRDQRAAEAIGSVLANRASC